MAIRVLYFAGIREQVGRATEEVILPDRGTTVGELQAHIAARGGNWNALASGKCLRAAVNQRMAQAETLVGDGDEVAFFPPVTGG